MTLRHTLAVLGLALAPLAAQAQLAVILVRHAELSGEPMHPQVEMPLSKVGAARAKRLAAMFGHAGIATIYVTEFVRTSETAQPLARQIGRKPVVIAKADLPGLIARLHASHSTQRVMVVGHADTLPEILTALGHPKQVQIKPYDYGNVFVVVPNGKKPPTVVRLRSD
ncbi:MAG TPA: phosphoglycerate mutase family protein [Albitalea sp.]|uniref:SixA phosphatase family protein n=1 Tax=Piscinibacter sp. TaxID=1903157 RepID=UPI002ED5FFEB